MCIECRALAQCQQCFQGIGADGGPFDEGRFITQRRAGRRFLLGRIEAAVACRIGMHLAQRLQRLRIAPEQIKRAAANLQRVEAAGIQCQRRIAQASAPM